MKSPIFIFSLPRAGSTLLQRILMSHNDIASIAEPWLILPQIYALKKQGSISEYSSYTANQGISDFIMNLPEKEVDYRNSLRDFILELYAKQCKNNELFFLDKTPRYYLIIDEIVELFPDAKFIFLFRNPLHVYASIVNTWGNKRFNKLFSTYDDIIFGTPKLSKAYIKHQDKSLSLKYEDLILNSDIELKKLFNYLGLEYKKQVLNKFSQQNTKGDLGDPTGTKIYSKISTEGLNKWETTFNSIIRKRFAIRLINKLNDKDLSVQGYSKLRIKKNVRALRGGNNFLLFRDLVDYCISYIIRKFKLYLFINKNFAWIRKRYMS